MNFPFAHTLSLVRCLVHFITHMSSLFHNNLFYGINTAGYPEWNVYIRRFLTQSVANDPKFFLSTESPIHD